MPNTYILIQAQTLTSSAASVTFSSIPATYTDLTLRTSIRLDSTAPNTYINFNNDSATTRWSTTYFRGNGSTVVSNRSTDSNEAYIINANVSTSTASTFSNNEIYIPSYSISSTRQTSTFSAQESDTASALTTFTSAYYNTSATVSAVKLLPNGGVNFVSGSSFYLYGIKNS